ncbi:MAG: hypothetical protein V4683_18680, partial [Bacteroidota bacterium]
NAIQNPEIGLMVFDKDLQEIFIFNNDGWKQGTLSKLPLNIFGSSQNPILKVNNILNLSNFNGLTALFEFTGISGNAIQANTNNGIGVVGQSFTDGTGIQGMSNSGYGGVLVSNSGFGLLVRSDSRTAITADNNNSNQPTVIITNRYSIDNQTSAVGLEMYGDLKLMGNSKVVLEANQYPIFLNYWTNAGQDYNDCKFYKTKENIVHLEGILSVTDQQNFTNHIFTLPIGYRPAKNSIFTASTAAGLAQIFINSNGEVRISGSIYLPSLDGISFRVD